MFPSPSLQTEGPPSFAPCFGSQAKSQADLGRLEQELRRTEQADTRDTGEDTRKAVKPVRKKKGKHTI